MKNFRSIIGSYVNNMSCAKKIDIALAALFTAIIEFRIGTYMSMCFTSEDVDTLARWFIGGLCVISMMLTFIFIFIGTIGESEGEQQEVTRYEYMDIMSKLTIGVFGIMAVLTPIYFANMEVMSLLAYTSVPCLLAVIALHCIYKIKARMIEEDGYDEE